VIRCRTSKTIHRLLLSEDRCADICANLLNQAGRRSVFSAFCTALEALLARRLWPLQQRERTRNWLGQNMSAHPEGFTRLRAESLGLTDQSPSRPHSARCDKAAVAGGNRGICRIFEQHARVVVPPTSLGTKRVEVAWAASRRSRIVYSRPAVRGAETLRERLDRAGRLSIMEVRGPRI